MKVGISLFILGGIFYIPGIIFLIMRLFSLEFQLGIITIGIAFALLGNAVCAIEDGKKEREQGKK